MPYEDFGHVDGANITLGDVITKMAMNKQASATYFSPVKDDNGNIGVAEFQVRLRPFNDVLGMSDTLISVIAKVREAKKQEGK